MSTRFLPAIFLVLMSISTVLRAADSSDLFLRAYQEFQDAERCERDGRLRDALNRYASAEKTLENILRNDPEWQRMVVEYRLRKTRESLARLRSSVTEAQAAPIEVEDPLPTGGFEIDIPAPLVSTRPPAGGSVRTPPSRGSAGSPVLESGLSEARSQIDTLRRELERARAELSGAKAEIDRTKTSLVETKSELAQTKASLENVALERDRLKAGNGKSDAGRLKEFAVRIEQLEAENEVLNDENKRLADKLARAANHIEGGKKALEATDKDRLALAAERDKALSNLKKAEENSRTFAKEKEALEKQLADQKPRLDLVARLETENKDLAARLQKAELALGDGSKVQADKQLLESLREETVLLKDRLAAARSELHARDESIKTLFTQLDEASAETARLRLDPKPTEEQKRVAEENELLKNIVLRQIKDQNERSQAVGNLEEELEKLQVRSDTLSSQLAVLSKPPAKLSEREMLIFRDPMVVLNDPGEVDMSVSLTVAKTSGIAKEAPKTAGEAAASLGPEARQLVEEAARLVRERRFTDAEKIYQKLTDDYPDNPFALSNLAVTQIHAGKLSAARVALEKALRLTPGDVFASINLSNIHCRQGRHDDAIAILNEVINKEPGNAVAHNYLAIALGKRGDNKLAEEHFRRSITLDANYSNAHFNLAVMYANTEPPALELARKHYDIAKSLGSEPDAVMERRLAEIPVAN